MLSITVKDISRGLVIAITCETAIGQDEVNMKGEKYNIFSTNLSRCCLFKNLLIFYFVIYLIKLTNKNDTPRSKINSIFFSNLLHIGRVGHPFFSKEWNDLCVIFRSL